MMMAFTHVIILYSTICQKSNVEIS